MSEGELPPTLLTGDQLAKIVAPPVGNSVSSCERIHPRPESGPSRGAPVAYPFTYPYVQPPVWERMFVKPSHIVSIDTADIVWMGEEADGDGKHVHSEGSALSASSIVPIRSERPQSSWSDATQLSTSSEYDPLCNPFPVSTTPDSFHVMMESEQPPAVCKSGCKFSTRDSVVSEKKPHVQPATSQFQVPFDNHSADGELNMPKAIDSSAQVDILMHKAKGAHGELAILRELTSHYSQLQCLGSRKSGPPAIVVSNVNGVDFVQVVQDLCPNAPSDDLLRLCVFVDLLGRRRWLDVNIVPALLEHFWTTYTDSQLSMYSVTFSFFETSSVPITVTARRDADLDAVRLLMAVTYQHTSNLHSSVLALVQCCHLLKWNLELPPILTADATLVGHEQVTKKSGKKSRSS